MLNPTLNYSQPTNQHKRLPPSELRARPSHARETRPAKELRTETERNSEIQQLRGEIDDLRQNEQNLKGRIGELDAEIADLEKRLKERGNRREELEQITQELAVAQKFLSTPDSLSQVEVVGAMGSLNEEIFNLTSIVADNVQVRKRHSLDRKSQRLFRDRVLSCAQLTAFLDVVIAKHLEDPLAVQLGWQAMLVQWCSSIIQAWVVTDAGRGELSGDLDKIYASVTSQNDQAVAGRWRAIYFGASDEVSSEARERLRDGLIQSLVALPALCGYISSQKVYDELASAFTQRIEPFLEKCFRFRKMVGEGITSANIRPLFVDSGDVYDPSYADLDYEDDEDISKEKQGIIACSLGLGLHLTRIARGENGRYVESREAILKPKVILQETLSEIIS